MIKVWNEFIKVLERAGPMGEKTLSNGTRLIGHVPQIAPLAYLHSVFPSLQSEDVAQIEAAVERRLNQSLVDLYLKANGVQIFSGSLNINGLRLSLDRSIESTLSQPFNISTANTFERPLDADEDMIFFGSYKQDGAKLYMHCEGSEVFKCGRCSAEITQQWSSFDSFLISEVNRFCALYEQEKTVLH